VRDIAIASAGSGNVVIYDDTRWVYQPKPRANFPETGKAGAAGREDLPDLLGEYRRQPGYHLAGLPPRHDFPGGPVNPGSGASRRNDVRHLPPGVHYDPREPGCLAGRSPARRGRISVLPDLCRIEEEDTAAWRTASGRPVGGRTATALLAIRIGKYLAYAISRRSANSSWRTILRLRRPEIQRLAVGCGVS
jgi:hypothetical protein